MIRDTRRACWNKEIKYKTVELVQPINTEELRGQPWDHWLCRENTQRTVKTSFWCASARCRLLCALVWRRSKHFIYRSGLCRVRELKFEPHDFLLHPVRAAGHHGDSRAAVCAHRAARARWWHYYNGRKWCGVCVLVIMWQFISRNNLLLHVFFFFFFWWVMGKT